MVARVEAEDVAAEQPLEQLALPRTDAEGFGIRPRNVPEHDDRRARQPLANVARHEREVIVLHEHDRVLGLRLVDHGVGEAPVHQLVVLPVGAAEHGPHVRDVAQRPDPFVGEAVVVAFLLLLRQPDAAQRVRRIAGRHADVVARIDGFAIGRAAAVRDPRSRARAHHRFDRGDEPAGRPAHHGAVRPGLVDVRLAVRDDDDLVAGELLAQQLAQRVRRPVQRHVVVQALLALDVAQHLAQVADQRRELGRGGGRRRAQRLVAQHIAHAGDPAAQADLRDQHRDAGDDEPGHHEQSDHPEARVRAAPLHEAHVVNDEQPPEFLAVARDRPHRDVQRLVGQHARSARVGHPIAAERRRPRLGVHDELSVGQAQAEPVQAFVADRALEALFDRRVVARDQRRRDRVVDRVAHQLRPDLDVADEPARGQRIDPGNDEERHQEQRDGQRHDEAQRQSQRAEHMPHEYTPGSNGPGSRSARAFGAACAASDV